MTVEVKSFFKPLSGTKTLSMRYAESNYDDEILEWFL